MIELGKRYVIRRAFLGQPEYLLSATIDLTRPGNEVKVRTTHDREAATCFQAGSEFDRCLARLRGILPHCFPEAV